MKHARSSHYPAIYLDSGLSFDAVDTSLEVRRGEDLALAVGDGMVRRSESGGIVGWGAGDEDDIPLQRKQGGEKTLLGTHDR